MHSSRSFDTTTNTATMGGSRPAVDRRISGATCDIWELVAPGEACPTCEDDFTERLARARGF